MIIYDYDIFTPTHVYSIILLVYFRLPLVEQYSTIDFWKPYVYPPYETSIGDTVNMADCTVIVIGEGNEGKLFDGLVSMIDESSQIDSLISERRIVWFNRNT